MKITFVNPSQKTKYPQPPIGLALLAGIAESKGNVVQIVDLNVNNEPKFNPVLSDLIGITAMTPTIVEAQKLLKDMSWLACKKVIGGVHPTIFPDSISNVDFVVRGEGENFLDYLIGKVNNPPRLENLDYLPYPAYNLLEMDRYKPHPPHGKYGKWLPMLTSRGCPYKCSFCSKAVFGNKYRHMSPIRVVEEIKYYIGRYKIKELGFYDDVFTMNESHTLDLLELLGPLGIKWSCETRVNLVNEQLLRKMKKAGCYSISYGLESGSQRILNTISKDTTLEQNRKAIELTNKVGIETVGYFIIGSPNEGVLDIAKTVEFSKSIPLDYAQFAISTPLPGSELFSIWSKTHTTEDWSKYSYEGSSEGPIFDDLIGRKSLNLLKSWTYRQFYIRLSYIWKRLLKLRSFADIRVSIQGFRMLLER
jgi:radical SAM superfamily enzyme YgiQ (UPF0313 family)